MDSDENRDSSPGPQDTASADGAGEAASEASAELQSPAPEDQAGETASEEGSDNSPQPEGLLSPESGDEMPSDNETGPSAAQITANRANTQKSTGPRSIAGKLRASGNALKNGRFAGRTASYIGTLHAHMIELGEDPDEFAKFEQGLTNSFNPTNEAQELLVHEIAVLHWQQHRLNRAASGVMSCRVRKFQIERERESLQVLHKMSADLQMAQMRAGLIWAPDSPTKFKLEEKRKPDPPANHHRQALSRGGTETKTKTIGLPRNEIQKSPLGVPVSNR
jgi:hypothetical protein